MNKVVQGFAMTACMVLSLVAARSASGEVADAVLQAEQQRIAAVAKAGPVGPSPIFANDGHGGGSGVVITPDGYALSQTFTSPSRPGITCSAAWPTGSLYDAVLVGLDPTGDVALIKLLGRDDFPAAETRRQRPVRVGRLVLCRRQSVPVRDRFPANRHLRHRLRRQPLPISRGDHLLEYADCIQTTLRSTPAIPAGRCSTRRPVDRHQRPRLVRESEDASTVGVGVCHLHQPDQELPRLPAQRPHRRPRHARRHRGR
jgi:serine protease Do